MAQKTYMVMMSKIKTLYLSCAKQIEESQKCQSLTVNSKCCVCAREEQYGKGTVPLGLFKMKVNN